MGEDLAAERRMAVRTPMQWTPGRNGGFSTADAGKLPSALVTGDFGPEQVNVSDSKQDSDSLLNFVTTLARRYRECPEFAWGTFEVLDQPLPGVFAHQCSWEGSSIIAIHNLGPEEVTVPLTLEQDDEGTELLDLLRSGKCTLGPGSAVDLDLPGYGFRWLRLQQENDGGAFAPDIVSTVAEAGKDDPGRSTG